MFRFETNRNLLSFLNVLHKKTSMHVKQQVHQNDEQCITDCFKELSLDNIVCNEWLNLTADVSGVSKGAKILGLQKFCTVFMKSKQKRVLDQMNLLPSKNNKSLAQSIGGAAPRSQQTVAEFPEKLLI